MKLRQLVVLKLAFENIRLNWRHSLATIMAITGGFTAISLFDGFVSNQMDYSEESYVNKGMVGHVVIEKAGAIEHMFEDAWQYSLDENDQETVAKWLKSDPRVKVSTRVLILAGLISNGSVNALFEGAAEEVTSGDTFRGEKWVWNTVAGKPFSHSEANTIQLGIGLAKQMGCKFNEKPEMNEKGSYVAMETPLECSRGSLQMSVTTESAQANAINAKLSGVRDMQLREFNDRFLALPLDLAQKLLDTKKVSRFSVLLHDGATARAFVHDFNHKAKAAGEALQATEWIDHPIAALAKGGIEILSVFRILFLSIVAVIAAMSVANSMMKSINERIREIGTLRSYGFRQMDIVLLFSFEGLLLGLFACLIGIVLSTAITYIVKSLGLTFKAGLLSSAMPLDFSVALSVWLTTALTLSFITFVASWFVSRRAAKMRVADALRHTA